MDDPGRTGPGGGGVDPAARRRGAPGADDRGELPADESAEWRSVVRSSVTTRTTVGTARTIAGSEHRSPEPSTCPFFRAADASGSLRQPVQAPDARNRCAALETPRPQSSLQQELVCLTPQHLACPRYEGGMLLAGSATAPRAPRGLTRATVAALVILALSAAMSFTFVMARGGITLPDRPTTTGVAAAPPVDRPEETAVASAPRPSRPPASVAPAGEASSDPAPGRTSGPSTLAAPTPTTSPPAVTPQPTAAPTPRPTRAPATTPRPVSDRYAVLAPCSSQPECWVYTIRPGDNLSTIGTYFGHSLDTIYRLNPWSEGATLQPGQQIVLPPPTR